MRCTTVKALRERHQQDMRRLVLAALERSEWRLSVAAGRLEVPAMTLRDMLEPLDLRALYDERNPGRGRPKL